MIGDKEDDKGLLGPHRTVRPSLRGRGAPPRTVNASALSVAERIRVARGLPQAIVKITSYARGTDACGRHWTYISRKGTLALESETGELLRDREEQRSLLEAWSVSFDKRTNARDQVNVVVSAPKGTPPEAVHKAAREFGKEAFPNQRYVFVLHEDKGHPHVHFAVALRGKDKKLDPRLKDLHRWRELWAKAARAQGIEMACSPRAARGAGRRRPPSKIYHLQHRGITSERTKGAVKETVAQPADTVWEQYVKERNQAERMAYRQSAADLRAAAKTASPAARVKLDAAAADLERFVASLPIAKTRRQQIREAITTHHREKSSLKKEPDDLER